MKRKTMREIALDLLVRIENQGGYSNLIISEAIKHNQMDPRDETLLTEIVYGTMERKITLDFYLEDYIKKQKKLNDWVQMLLRMSVYQIAYLDKVPTFAVINEAGNIAKKKGHKGIVSFVNGVLRNIDRHGLKSTEEIKDSIKKLSIETSHPEWLIKRWVAYYGEETTAEICRENITKKPLSVRVNVLQTNREAVLTSLAKAGIEAKASAWMDEAVLIEKGNILRTEMIGKGEVTIQDQSSMLAAKSVETKAEMKVLDACSAPGGKATFIGEAMHNKGEIHAYDLHENKINLIKKSASRLGLTNINAAANDARTLQDTHQQETFDRILVDAPCSGFGVIRSKPDIKYQKSEKDIIQLQKVQQQILDQVAPLLKISGKLVYSTCTIEKEENEWQIEAFLERNPQFKIDDSFLNDMKQLEKGIVTDYGIQIFPQSFHSDGFFISRLIKVPF